MGNPAPIRFGSRSVKFSPPIASFHTPTLLEPAEIERCRGHLADIEERLGNVSVPLAYADMLYRLRLHLQFVRERLEEVAEDTVGSVDPGDRDS